MNSLDWNIATVASVIDIAVAPVFLLAGVSGLLMVLTSRLGRAIDRSRSLQAVASEVPSDHHLESLEQEMTILVRRIHLCHAAIGLATLSAILVCSVVITLFVGNLVQVNVSVFIASLFIVCMGILSLAFVCFFIEVLIANRASTLRATLLDAGSFRRPRTDRAAPGSEASGR